MVNCCTAVIFIALTGIIHSIELYMCSTVCMYTHTFVPMMQSTQHYVKCNVSVVFMLNGVCTASDLHCAGCVCLRHIHEVSDVKDFKGNRLVSLDCLKCQRHRKPLHFLAGPLCQSLQVVNHTQELCVLCDSLFTSGISLLVLYVCNNPSSVRLN